MRVWCEKPSTVLSTRGCWHERKNRSAIADSGRNNSWNKDKNWVFKKVPCFLLLATIWFFVKTTYSFRSRPQFSSLISISLQVLPSDNKIYSVYIIHNTILVGFCRYNICIRAVCNGVFESRKLNKCTLNNLWRELSIKSLWTITAFFCTLCCPLINHKMTYGNYPLMTIIFCLTVMKKILIINTLY
jgi:hypothetical protein